MVFVEGVYRWKNPVTYSSYFDLIQRAEKRHLPKYTSRSSRQVLIFPDLYIDEALDFMTEKMYGYGYSGGGLSARDRAVYFGIAWALGYLSAEGD